MPGLGEIIVILVLLAVVALAIRSLWMKKKTGGCCGDCSKCGCCGHGEQPSGTK